MRWLRRWGRGAAFGLRFAYGLRSVLPLTLGAARFPPALFIPANVAGAVAFAGVYLSLGYFFGEAAERMFAHVRGSAPRVAAGITTVGMAAWAGREWWLFHERKQAARRPSSPAARLPDHPSAVDEQVRGEERDEREDAIEPQGLLSGNDPLGLGSRRVLGSNVECPAPQRGDDQREERHGTREE